MTGPAVIHVVDDDASHLTAVARMLKSHGFTVRTYHLSLIHISEPTRH